MDNKPKTTAKDFFLWAAAMVALYWSVIAYVNLVFDYINYAFPDTLGYFPANPYDSGIGFEMASILVLFPVFVILRKLIEKMAVTDPTKNELWVRRWALIATLFFAGLAFVIDVITLLTQFFGGNELTTAFLLKVFVVALVAAGVFMHFIADLGGYWTEFPARKRMVVIGVSLLAVATIGLGFYLIGTPQQARLSRFDEQKINDLRDLQYRIGEYWRAKRVLPAALKDLATMPYASSIPLDPQTKAAYEYEIVGATTFKLCATFNTAGNTSSGRGYSVPEMVNEGWDSWQHTAGYACFTRILDESFYPKPSMTNVL